MLQNKKKHLQRDENIDDSPSLQERLNCYHHHYYHPKVTNPLSCLSVELSKISVILKQKRAHSPRIA